MELTGLDPTISPNVGASRIRSLPFRCQVDLVLTEAVAKLGDFGVAKDGRTVGHSTERPVNRPVNRPRCAVERRPPLLTQQSDDMKLETQFVSSECPIMTQQKPFLIPSKSGADAALHGTGSGKAESGAQRGHFL